MMSGPEPKRRKRNRMSMSEIQTNVNGYEPVRNSNIQEFTQYCGVIQKVVLRNVFCHEYLDFDGFTTGVNLLQGKNGSGKSSIVAAVIAGLGGSSRDTDRGTSLTSLIQHGKQWASIEIHLSNVGFNPYRPEVFGEKIIVERKLQMSGSSSYKVKSENGQIISQRKEELNKILDKFSLQIDNPVLILSQERAKTFLSSTNPKSLFNFFMTSTQLKQLKEEINETMSNVKSSKSLVISKKESLKFMERDVKEWGKKLEAINALRDRRGKLIELHREKVWAEVKEIETELEELKKKKLAFEKINKKLEVVLKNVLTEKESLEKEIKKSDASMVDLSSRSKTCTEKMNNTKVEFLTAKSNYREKLAQKKLLEKDIFDRERDVSCFKKKLEEDNNETTAKWEESIKILNSEKTKLQERMNKLEEEIKSGELQLVQLTETWQMTEEDFKHLKAEEKALYDAAKRLKVELNSTRNQRDNLTVFGQYIPKVISEVNKRVDQFKIKPVGPLGQYIKVRNEDWIHIVENTARSVLSAFLVFSSQDYQLLKQIFNHNIPKDIPRPQIIISPFRNTVHDVRRFEVRCDRYFSMWSIVEVNNINVANILLDQLRMESILLVPNCLDAIELLVDRKRVPKNCERAMTLNGDTVLPDPNHGVYSGTGNRQVNFLQISVEDKMKELQKNIESTEGEARRSTEEVREKKQEVDQTEGQRNYCMNKLKELKKRKNDCLRNLHDLKNKELPPPPDIYQLQTDLKESEALKTEAEEKLQVCKEELQELHKTLQEAEKRLQEIKNEGQEINASWNDCNERSNKMNEKLLMKKKERMAYEKKIEENGEKYKEIIDLVKDKEEKLTSKLENITDENHERIETNKLVKDIEREIQALKKAIAYEESQYGDLDEIKTTFREKRSRYESIKNELLSQELFITKMELSMGRRKHLLNASEKLYRTLLRNNFSLFISKRNMTGCIDVSYKDETLKILMRKDARDNSKELQSLQMMSGGERSFATVSFILSLWDMVHSPIRIMDEFDIFMDVVSRSQCVEMILDSMKKEIQYIMVSPLEYRVQSNSLKIFRMPDPERNKKNTQERRE